MTASKRVRLEKHLADLHHCIATSEGQLRVDRIEAGETLTQLRASFGHGRWMTYSADLYKRLKLSRKTAERYIAAYKEVASFGPALRAAAKKSGLDFNKTNVRDYVKEIRTQNPDASADEIVKLTNMAMEAEAEETEAARREDAARAEAARCKHPGCSSERIVETHLDFSAQSDFCEEHEPSEEKAQREAKAKKNDQERAERDAEAEERYQEMAEPFYGRFAARSAPRASSQVLAEAKEIIESGYRARAKKNHPDSGGLAERMQVTNAAISWLRQVLKNNEERLAPRAA